MFKHRHIHTAVELNENKIEDKIEMSIKLA